MKMYVVYTPLIKNNIKRLPNIFSLDLSNSQSKFIYAHVFFDFVSLLRECELSDKST